MIQFILSLFIPEIAYAATADPWGGADFGTSIIANITGFMPVIQTPVLWIVGVLLVCIPIAMIIRALH